MTERKQHCILTVPEKCQNGCPALSFVELLSHSCTDIAKRGLDFNFYLY